MKINNRKWNGTIIHTVLFTLILIYYSPIPISWKYTDFLLGCAIGFFIYLSCFFIRILHINKYFFPRDILKKFDINLSTHVTKQQGISLIVFFLSTIMEELLLRSYILFLSMKYLPLYLSIIINAIFFHLIHLDNRIIELIISGIIYCLVVIYTGNILTSIMAHITYNLLAYFKILVYSEIPEK